MDSTTNETEKLPCAPQSIYQAFGEVVDPRSKRGIRYPLAVILTVVTLAKLCGETEVRGIAQWAKYRASRLCAVFGLPREGMPHWTTYSRVLSQVDEEALQQAIQAGLRAAGVRDSQLIMDGKTLRGTIPPGQTQGEHLLAVYAPDSRTVVAQVPVATKANEIGVAPQVLAQTPLQGKVVTGDALFTQRELSAQIVDAKGHYVWVVKDNQAGLLKMIELLFKPQLQRPGHGRLLTDFKTATRFDKRHGRLERRSLTTSSLLQGYSD